MSSFKNAAQNQRRTHRERSQPAHRKKFGLLEKAQGLHQAGKRL